MKKLAPQWIVDDVEDTVSFYTENLEFQVDWIGDPPLFAILSKGSVTIMIRKLRKANQKRPNRIPFINSGWHTNAAEAWDAYIWVENADELFALIKKKSIKIIREIQDRDYASRDFEIEDNNGYILCFGHSI
jgi:uncharacterized glyoxalase superfamily protein PhnB